LPATADAEKPTANTDVRMIAIGWMKLRAIEPARLNTSPPPKRAGGHVTYPFWANLIPKFIANQGGTTPGDLSYVASLPLGNYSFDTRGTVGAYTGADGPQQSAEELIFSLPNGLQGYVLLGTWNQRRVDAFTNIVRDPRILRRARSSPACMRTHGAAGARSARSVS
jgi:hypothetical protein